MGELGIGEGGEPRVVLSGYRQEYHVRRKDGMDMLYDEPHEYLVLDITEDPMGQHAALFYCDLLMKIRPDWSRTLRELVEYKVRKIVEANRQ